MLGPQGKRIIEVDPETGPHVKRFFELYAAGGVSLRDLGNVAAEAGLVYKKSGREIPTTTLLHVLKNRIYFGEIEWHERIYVGNHVPLVSRDLFDKVQAMLNGNSLGGGPEVGGPLMDYQFRGLVRCGRCSRLLSPYRIRDSYTYYTCPKCPKTRAREAELEHGFGEALAQLKFSDEIRQEIVKALKESVDDQQKFHREALGTLQAQYDRLQKRLEGVYQDKLDGEVDLETYRRMSSAWRTEQSEVFRRMEAHQQADQNYLEEGVMLLELLQHLETAYKLANCTERQKILKFIISNSQWIDGKLKVEFRKPFCFMVNLDDDPEDDQGGEGDDSGGCTIAPGRLYKVLTTKKAHLARMLLSPDIEIVDVFRCMRQFMQGQ